MSKRAIVTGITGQDGSYLAELLLEKGYPVVGVTPRLISSNHWRIRLLLDSIELRPADLLDQRSLIRIIADVRPHEFYNLGAMSFVPASRDQPFLTGEFNSQGMTRALIVGAAKTQHDRRVFASMGHLRPPSHGRFVNSSQ